MKSNILLKSSKLAMVLLSSAALLGCGGGGSAVQSSAALDTGSGSGSTTPVSYSVSGTVTGLDGIAEIIVNGESISQSIDGGFEFLGVVTEGETVSIEVPSDPFGQACAVAGDATIQNVRSDITDIVVSCVDIPVVNVRVQDFSTGDNLGVSDVRMTRQEDGVIITETAVINNEGVAAFEVPSSAGRLSFKSDLDGYGAQTTVVETPSAAGTVLASIYLKPVDVSQSFNTFTGGNVTDSGETLAAFSENSFVDANGAPLTGDVNVDLTLLDASQSIDVLPGDFLAQDLNVDPNTGGVDIRSLESLGAFSLKFTDSAGSSAELSADKTATIRIPVAARVSENAPDTASLYLFDEDTGYWMQEGSATLMDLTTEKQAYQGLATKSGIWMTGTPPDTVEARGCVVDQDKLPVSGVRMRSRGVDYIGSSRGTSDERGEFRLQVKANATTFISAFGGTQSRTRSVTANSWDFVFAAYNNPGSCMEVRTGGLSANSAIMELTWGKDPNDLDTFFYGVPAVETASNTPFQIAYYNREVTVNDQTIFLDVDDVSSYGPEIVTVPTFPYEGVYTYAIDLFAGDGTIASSPARVQINLGADVSIYSPPEGTPTRCWAVMRFIVDADGNVTTEDINTWEDRSYCTSGNGIPGSATADQSDEGAASGEAFKSGYQDAK